MPPRGMRAPTSGPNPKPLRFTSSAFSAANKVIGQHNDTNIGDIAATGVSGIALITAARGFASHQRPQRVAVGGGCEDHVFGLCWDETLAESEPPQATVWLSHEDNDDACDSIVSETHVWDLTPIQVAEGGKSGTVVVNVEKDGGKVTYSW